jgi:hypothetical protein
LIFNKELRRLRPLLFAESPKEIQRGFCLGVDRPAGVLSAARTAPCPRPTAFSLKSVCDMADEKKDDRWQSYAAYTSARSIQAFFERFMTELADIAG